MALGDPILMPSASSGQGGGLIGIQVLGPGAGNYVPTSGTKSFKVRLVAGGGAGGGASSNGPGSAAAGAGGGSGGYAERWYVGALLASYPYVVGAAGAVGAAGNNPGGAGGNSSFNTPDMTAVGGLGGGGMAFTAATMIAAGGDGGAATVTALGFAKNGDPGSEGFQITAAGPWRGSSGEGGSNPLGGGGNGRFATAAGSSGHGNPGTGYGAGGGGGAQAETGTDRTGGAGAPGVIIIEEYA